LRLCDGDPARQSENGAWLGWRDGVVDYVIAAYGIRRFFSDIDAGERYAGAGVIHSVLAYASGPGFGDFAERAGIEYESALAFRQRHILKAMKGRV
jgi:hypothetical protein